VNREAEIERRRLSFGSAAALYDSARPSYPAEAARWILGDEPVRVADMGAGTGIFSRVLAGLGHEVVAVEPDPGMRAAMLAHDPAFEVVEGSGEAIPLPDRSVDAVTAAQSFHWFDNAAAHAEIARVLRPGGHLGVVWNVRDESLDWVAELGRTAGLEDGTRNPDHLEPITLPAAFAPAERGVFPHTTTLTRDQLLLVVQSRSQYIIATDDEKAEMKAAVGRIADGLPDTFELPYVAVAFRAELLGQA
jgi:SAM-dependent methyltransferase